MKSTIRILLLSVFIILLTSFDTEPVQKRVIRTKDYDVHFYVSLRKKRTIQNKEYFWYKSGEIHKSQGNSAGDLLHLQYVKFYVDNNLAEKGDFEYGLKKGIWEKWYRNGTIMEKSRWVDGVKYGPYSSYDDKGDLVTSGKYRDNNKEGVWINWKTLDTTWYKDGLAFKENPKILKKKQDATDGKKGFFKKLFSRRDSTVVVEKDNFLKRLFQKNKLENEDPKIKLDKKIK